MAMNLLNIAAAKENRKKFDVIASNRGAIQQQDEIRALQLGEKLFKVLDVKDKQNNSRRHISGGGKVE